MWGWIGHTLRGQDGHLAKTTLEWKLQGKCKRERDPDTLRGTQRCQNLKREGFRGMRQKSLLKIQSGFEH